MAQAQYNVIHSIRRRAGSCKYGVMAVTTSQDERKTQRPFKICTLWVHEENFSKEDIVFNASKFVECAIQAGSLARIIAIKPATAVRDFQNTNDLTNEDEAPNPRRGSASGLCKPKQDIFHEIDEPFYDENGAKVEDGRLLDFGRYYVFMAEDASSELKTKSPTLQISLSAQVAAVFGFRRGMQVAVSAVSAPRTLRASKVFYGLTMNTGRPIVSYSISC